MEKKQIIMTSVIATIFIIMATVTAMYQDGKTIAEEENFYIVSNTEYWSGETGQVIARFVNFLGNPITVNNCTTDILYPNSTTYFVQDALMTSSMISGDHYYQFTVPDEEGVYDYKVKCIYQS